jgi:heat shock protein HslJ
MRRLFLLLGLTCCVACGDSLLNPSELKDVTWKLESIERVGAAPTQVPNPEQYTLTLGNDGRLSARADCNSCSTTYRLDGPTLRVGRLACTLISCGLGSLDGTYAALLEGSTTISVGASRLTLQNSVVTLRFRN